jgi:hypothetical protein
MGGDYLENLCAFMEILQMLKSVNLFSLIVGKTLNFRKKNLVRILQIEIYIWLHYLQLWN